MLTVPPRKYSVREATFPAVPQSIAFGSSAALRQLALYFHVPLRLPPHAPPNGQTSSLFSFTSEKWVKWLTRPTTLPVETVDSTGNHWPLAASSHAITTFLSDGIVAVNGRVRLTGAVK